MRNTGPWHAADLVALDLEGTGAQDRDNEAILEIATVPLTGGQPDLDRAYCTLINPGRPVPHRPWISPGLTDAVLTHAPPIAELRPQLSGHLDRNFIVGHNIAVDWRLLRRHHPCLAPRGLLDTLRLACHPRPRQKSLSLTALMERYQLTEHVNRLAGDSQPHRALWDATASALLLRALIAAHYDSDPTIGEILAAAGVPLSEPPDPQPSLFD